MTDEQSPESPVDAPETEPEGDGDTAALRREAARYRRTLREAEAERDSLRTAVQHYQRAEIERIAANHLAQPSDLFLVSDQAELLADDGTPDPEKIGLKCAEIVRERPSWAPRTPNYDGGARTSAAAGPSWSNVLRPDGGRS